MSELKSKLVITVEKALALRYNPAELYLLRWHNSKNRLQPLVVELCLIAEILEGKSEELALGHSSDTEIEPGPIVIVLGSHMWRRVT